MLDLCEFFNDRSKGLTMQIYFHSLLWSYLPRVPTILTMSVCVYIYIYIYIIWKTFVMEIFYCYFLNQDHQLNDIRYSFEFFFKMWGCVKCLMFSIYKKMTKSHVCLPGPSLCFWRTYGTWCRWIRSELRIPASLLGPKQNTHSINNTPNKSQIWCREFRKHGTH